MEPEITQPVTLKRSIIVALCTGILAALVVGATVYVYEHGQQTTKNKDLQAQIDVLRTQVITDSVSNWKTYADTTVGVSFQYPATWTIDKTSTYISFLSPESVIAQKNNIQNFQADNMTVYYYSSAKDLTDEQGKPTNSANLEEWLVSQKGSSAVQSYSTSKIPLVNYGSYTLYSVTNSFPSVRYYLDISDKVFVFAAASSLRSIDSTILQSIKLLPAAN
jgi:hypothetical protein